MNILESIFLQIGLGWSFSKILVYILVIIFSVILARFQRRWSTKIVWIYWSRIIFVSIFPVLLYFAFNPIYAGDLVDYSEEVDDEFVFKTEKCLNIIVLKGCPHCKNTVQFSDMLLKRNPSIKINYVVLGLDNENRGFLDEINKNCTIEFVKESKKLQALTKGSFPTFVLSENSKARRRWGNDKFGFRSLDVIENYLVD